jgi:RHS repeat-associated protein
VKRILFFGVYSLLVLHIICCFQLLYSQESGVEIAKKMWRELKAIKPEVAITPKCVIESKEYPIIDEPLDQSMCDYWYPIGFECQKIFIAALTKAHKNNQVESFAKEYAAFLGSEDRETDMRWILACPTLTVPSRRANNYSFLAKQKTIGKEIKGIIIKEEFKLFAVAFNKAVVEKALDSKDFYLRIHYLYLWWSKSEFRDLVTHLDYCNEISSKKITENDILYWFAVRQLLSLAYLCDCENELIKIRKNLNTANILSAYELIFKRVRLLSSCVTYDQSKLRYVYGEGFGLPAVPRVDCPFPDTIFSSEKKNNALPRISSHIISNCIDIFHDKITTVIDAENNQTLYFHDSLGRQIAVIQPPAGEDNTRLASENFYDFAGNVIANVVAPFDATTLKSIENKKRVTRFERDAIGRVTKIIQPHPTLINTDGAITRNEYDLNGNIIKTIDPLWNETNYRYEYDREGNRISKTSIKDGSITKYTWDNRNRLIKVESQTGSVEYIYDYLNRLVKRTQDKNETHFIHDEWQIILQFDNKNLTPTHRYLWGVKQDELLCDNENWTLGDHLNTIRDIIKSDGTVADHLEYNSFGILISVTKNPESTFFAYTGKLTDKNSDLQWNINRWYDANVGRWVSEDPIGFNAFDENLYRYINNQVTMLIDPSGMKWTVPQYFHWYYVGGGQTVTLSFTGLLDDYITETAVTRKLQVTNAVEVKSNLDCNNKKQSISGDINISTAAGGGILNPLTVLGNSLYKAVYVCSLTLTYKCCESKIIPLKQKFDCRVTFNFKDRFANPLDWNGTEYEKKEDVYKACKQDCYKKYKCPWHALSFKARVERMQCLVDRSHCLEACDAMHPRSEFYGAYPYEILETFADQYTWETQLNNCQ